MSEVSGEQIKGLMREFVKALEEGDVAKALSFFTEDVTFVTPVGTFEGQEALRRYFEGTAEAIPDLTITPSGIDIVVDGSRAAYEHVMAGTYQGKTCEWLAMCAYEFRGEKIQGLRVVFDRLEVVEQAASGWLQTTLVAPSHVSRLMRWGTVRRARGPRWSVHPRPLPCITLQNVSYSGPGSARPDSGDLGQERRSGNPVAGILALLSV